jgi:hypothetical protein
VGRFGKNDGTVSLPVIKFLPILLQREHLVAQPTPSLTWTEQGKYFRSEK